MSTAAMPPDELCLDGVIPLESGFFIGSDDAAELDASPRFAAAFAAPPVDGVAKVHFGADVRDTDPKVRSFFDRIPAAVRNSMTVVPRDCIPIAMPEPLSCTPAWPIAAQSELW